MIYSRPKQIENGVRISLILPRAVVEIIDDIAARNGATRSGIVRMQLKKLFTPEKTTES